MSVIAGIDVGNSTTEVALAEIGDDYLEPHFLASSTVMTTGIKGTLGNIPGIVHALHKATENAKISISDLDFVLLNEATPVIGDVAMETITETVVTESSMIGHNPGSPGGVGIGVGQTVHIRDLDTLQVGEPVIVVVPKEYDFEVAASLIRQSMQDGIDVQGGIAQGDDGVLITNRLPKALPFVDEVALIDRVPLNMLAAVEVASQGQAVRQLSNPYGIATLFSLSPQETTHIIPISKALIGLRSAVVIRTPSGDVQSRKIPAGSLRLIGEKQTVTVRVDSGAEAIMSALAQATYLLDVEGEAGTNVGGMIARVRQTMSDVTEKPLNTINIHDVLAVDCLVPQKVTGGIAQEFSIENATGLAVMVATDRLLMEHLAAALAQEIGIHVELGGVEAKMAALGTLTTPGIDVPLAILDIGAGSTDAALVRSSKKAGHKLVERTIHLAGAGHMVTLLIKNELGLDDDEIAEQIKLYPLAKVETLFHIRNEDNTVRFFKEPLDPRLFGRVALVAENKLIPIPTRHPLDRIRAVRQEAKQRVLVRNSLRALEYVAPAGNVRLLDFVAIVGRSGLDFELSQMLTKELSGFGIVVGTANVRGTEGALNAVATGLVLSYSKRQQAEQHG